MYRHLSLAERSQIEALLTLGSNLTEIAIKLNRNISTISREIKRYRYMKKSNNPYRGNICIHRQSCNKADRCDCFKIVKNCHSCNKCNEFCKHFQPIMCEKLGRKRLVCNGCDEKRRCINDKYFYNANNAQNNYMIQLVESRQGINMEESDLIELDAFLAPLVGKGHSMYAIINNNPDKVKPSISTLYNYRSQGVLRLGGNLPPRVIRFKKRKKRNNQNTRRKERIDRVSYGYEAYTEYLKHNPNANVIEMDVVEAKKGGKVLLTLIVKKANFILAFLLDEKRQDEVKNKIDELESALGTRRFRRLFEVILTDNGSEFINPDKISLNKQGKLRTKIFYCDPYSPQQKGTLENAHSLVRRVIPKGVSIDHLTQEDVDIMINNLNSYTRKSLNGKSPYQIMKEVFGATYLNLLNVRSVAPNDVQINPDLFLLANKMKWTDG